MEKFNAFDGKMMRRAITLARKGWGSTPPNPMVGAVIVKDGRVLGEGWHRGPGQPHAEVEAIRACRESPAGATIYVTLEPCNHHGRTPPCSEGIIQAGIGEVIFAVADSNPRVAGGGKRRLLEAGIRVREGLCEAEAGFLIRDYLTHCHAERPWVIMKAAMSLDGKIADVDGVSQWITNPDSRRFVHRLRAHAGAVLIGIGTALADNPRLTNREAAPIRRQPFKVVMDSRLKLPMDSNLLRENPEKLIVFCGQGAEGKREDALVGRGARVIRQSGERPDPGEAIASLGKMGIQSILVEGGREVFASLIEQDLVDEYYLFYGPILLGGDRAMGLLGGAGQSLSTAPRLHIRSVRRFGDDIMVHALNERSEAPCSPVSSRK